jgi:uncharacterized damage-inducible protein DinB
MYRAELRKLTNHHYWANHKLQTALANISTEDFTRKVVPTHPSLQETLTHMIFAEYIWRLRVQHGMSPTKQIVPSDFPTPAALIERWQEEEREIRDYVRNVDESILQGLIVYTDSKGNEHVNKVSEVLQHLFLHGMQHRAEAALMLTNVGQSPGNLDMIIFLRENPRADDEI